MTVLSSLCPVCPLICKGFFQTYSSKYVLLGPGWNVSGLCTLQVPILNLSSSLTPLYRGTPQFCLWFLIWSLDLDLDFQIFNLATVTKLKLATHPFMRAQLLSHVWLFATPWIIAHQAALCPWDFSRQEYWTGFPFPSPGDLPNPGIEPTSPTAPALAFGFFTFAQPGKAHPLTHWKAKPTYWPQDVVEVSTVFTEKAQQGVQATHAEKTRFSRRIFKGNIWGNGCRMQDFLLTGWW